MTPYRDIDASPSTGNTQSSPTVNRHVHTRDRHRVAPTVTRAGKAVGLGQREGALDVIQNSAPSGSVEGVVLQRQGNPGLSTVPMFRPIAFGLVRELFVMLYVEFGGTFAMDSALTG